jgi:hypothetical protein
MGKPSGTAFYVTVDPPKKPANHSKRCQCDRCKVVGFKVRAPSPQLALHVLGARVGAVLPAPLPAPPPPPAPPAPTEKPKRPKPQPLPAGPLPTPAAPPPGGFKAWMQEQGKKD